VRGAHGPRVAPGPADRVAFWTAGLAGAPEETPLPWRGKRPPRQTFNGATFERALPAAAAEGLRRLAREHGATLYMTLLAAVRVLLARYSGQRDLVLGSPVANRTRPEIEGVIGMFANTIALRNQVEPGDTFATVLAREKQRTRDALDHQQTPFESVVDALGITRDLSRSPVVQVIFNHLEGTRAFSTDEWGALRSEPIDRSTGAHFDLSVTSVHVERALAVRWTYNTDLFDTWLVEQLASDFETLVDALVARSDAPLAHVPILSGAQRARVLVEHNRTPGEPAPATTIPAMFEAQVDRTPDAIAVELGDARWTYRQLDARANQIAHVLRARGVGPEVVVGIALERSLDLVASILGVSKAGGAWVPMDPHLPAARLQYLADMASPALVVDAALLAAIPRDARAARVDHRAVTSANLAYVLFTSGSTGRPKGVAITHDGIVNELVSAQTIRAHLDGSDAFLQLAPYTFDLSVHEILWPLTTGARLVLLREGDHRDPAAIAAAMHAHGITIMHPVPTVLRALLADGELERCPTLRTMCSGGEAMPLDVLRAFTARLPHVTLINSYGPTETSVTVSQWRARPDAAAPAIGKPYLATQFYVLDDQLEPVPLGVAGELYIGGRQVGRGYVGRAGLAAERFVADPFGAPGARMYRTGDRARRWPDGNVEVLGRIDGQVKLRGFRIELGEIEQILATHPAVRQAVVVVRGDRLVAYLTGTPGARLDAAELTAHAARDLPAYMVPAAIVSLDAFPLTASGKIDRNALPDPGEDAYARGEHVAPRPDGGRARARIGQGRLGVERVGARDDFFSLGGHSLLATRLVAQIRTRFDVELPLGAVFEHPTIEGLASQIARARGGAQAAALVPVARGEHPVLSRAQQRLWFLHQLAPDANAYLFAFRRRIRGAFDIDALRRAFEALVARHEILRTVFPAVEGVPYQQVLPPPRWELAVERDVHVDEVILDERRRPLDLAVGPLVRTRLVRVADDEHVLVLVLHHMLYDGWSIDVLWRELGELYAAAVRGAQAELPALPIQYADYAAWEHASLTGDTLAGQLAFWKEQLAGAPEETPLPWRGKRPPRQTFEGETLERILPAALADRVRTFAREHGATLYMTLLAALRVVVARYSGQRDLVIGSPVANRGQQELEGMIGLFANTIALRNQVDATDTFASLVTREKARARAAFAHQQTPFDLVVDTLGITRDLSRSPVFQVLFNHLEGAREDGSAADGRLALEAIDRNTGATFDLSVTSAYDGRSHAVHWTYNTDLFDAWLVEQMASDFELLIETLLDHPNLPLVHVPTLAGERRARVLVEHNRTPG